jgi:A/G-specific adenine glycosylase
MSFADILCQWYLVNQRDLPWRETKDPYKIWVSEVILQQTQVKFGLAYYLRFIDKYPDLESLLHADIDELMRLWQGLGYYNRLINMTYAAKQIFSDFGGVFPNTYVDLLKLKGVGGYIAAAVASFAFDEPVPVVDGNVKRVICRLFLIKELPESAVGKQEIQFALNSVFDSERPALFNQAMMEFGALQCTKSPDCPVCPVSQNCLAFQNGVVQRLPLKKRKLKKAKRNIHYFIHNVDDKFALIKRGREDIWPGLYEFPNVECDSDESTMIKVFCEKYNLIREDVVFVQTLLPHVLSHQEIISSVYVVKDNFKVNDLNYYSYQEILDLPKSRLTEKIMNLEYVNSLFTSSF